MEASDLKRIKELKAENARLKRKFADLAIDNTAMNAQLFRGFYCFSACPGMLLCHHEHSGGG